MKSIIITLLVSTFLIGSATAADNPVIIMETSKGTIKLELYPEKAPTTVNNFLGYVDDKFYDGTLIHRVSKDFLLQGGGFASGMKPKKAKKEIKNEAGNGLKNQKYTIAMAHNPERADSATSQFFINLADNENLNKSDKEAGFCVFGKVISGQNVIDEIGKVKTITRGYHIELPEEEVVVKKVSRAK